MCVAAAGSLPAIVMQAPQRTQAGEQGVVGFRLERTFDVHAGPFHRHDELLLAVVDEDGRTIKVRVLRNNTGTHVASDSENAQLAEKYAHPDPGDVFYRPFDLRYGADYRCEMSDAHTVHFKSLVRDSNHGDGTFSVSDSGNVVAFAYSPNVLPQYSSSGTIADERSEVLPGYWAMTRETHRYSGRYAIFGGNATVLITQSHFQRFTDEASALASLDAGRL